METEEFAWMVREALWALFPQIRENSSFGFVLLVLLLDGRSLPRRGLLAEHQGGHRCRSLQKNLKGLPPLEQIPCRGMDPGSP